MDWTKIRRKTVEAEKPRGVYANLDDLIRIQFEARDFSFLPRQPVSSVLSGRYASRLRGRGLNFEELRRYFPAQTAVNGLFELAERLYGIRLSAEDDVSSWHEDVRYYSVRDADDKDAFELAGRGEYEA